MKRSFVPFAALAALAVVPFAMGCGGAGQPAPKPAAQTTKPADEHKEEGHGPHGAGPNGGVIADWGGGKYHVEFTVDHDKQEATVYVLGSDEKTPTPVKANNDSLLLTIKSPAFQVTLNAAPLEGEPEGTASRFVGKHESLGIVQEFAGSIKAKIDDTAYVGDFKEEPHGEHEKK